MPTEFERIVRTVTADWRRNKGLPPLASEMTIPQSIRRQDMARLDHSYVDLEISTCGVTREVEAKVTYIHSRAFGPIYDGSGPVSPEEPERAEIQTVSITGTSKDAPYFDICHLLTDEQMDAIESEILEQGA